MYLLCQSSYISSTKCHVWLVAAVLGTEKSIFISTGSPVRLPQAECFIPTTRPLNPTEENHHAADDLVHFCAPNLPALWVLPIEINMLATLQSSISNTLHLLLNKSLLYQTCSHCSCQQTCKSIHPYFSLFLPFLFGRMCIPPPP